MSGPKRDILYVDDELDNIIVFEAAFEDDFNVIPAASAKEALGVLERRPVPVVVSDHRMPEMSGVELFEVMRKRHPFTKRVILTGYTDTEAMVDAINKGQVFHYLKKPWERHELLSVLKRALEAHDLGLENARLTDRLALAERSAMLGHATARIAHEMGNQLCILPLLELIEEEYAHDEQLVQVGRFARETYDRLVSLINEVKAFVRTEDKDFERTALPLADAVRELASFLRFDTDVPYERLKVDIQAEPVVPANKVKLQQVLVNLVHNAAHAIRGRHDGRIDLTVGLEGNQAVIRVSDNGSGIPPDLLDRIWDPFFTTKGEEGTGLGLDISRRLIEAHGGTITCESMPGQGTTFELRLPIDGSNEQPAPPSVPAPHAVPAHAS